MAKYNLVGAYYLKDWAIKYPLYISLDSYHDDEACQYILWLVKTNKSENIFTVHESIFNIFATLINQGKLSNDDVTFTTCDENHNEKIHKIDENGFLTDWSYGFFGVGYLDDERLPEENL